MTDRRTTISLEVQDKFSQSLNNFSTGMNNAAESMKKVSTSATKLDEVGRKVDDVGKKSQGMSDKLQTAFGGSSRAVNTFGNAVGSAIGLSGEFGYTLDVLMDSGLKAGAQFALLTGATIVLGKAFEEINKHATGEYLRMDTDAARKSVLAMNDLAAATNAVVEARAKAYGADPDKSKALVGTMFEPAYAKDARAAAAQAMEDINTKYASLAAAVREYTKAQEDSIIKTAAGGGSMYEAAAALAKAEGKSEDFNKSLDVQLEYLNRLKRGVNEYGAALANMAEGYTAAGVSGLASAFVAPGRSADDARDPYEIQRSVWGMPDNSGVMREREAAARERANGVASILKQTQSQALSLYKSLSEGSDKTSKQVAADFADTFVGIMEAEAELNNNSSLSMIQLQQVFGKAFSGMSQDMVGKLLGVMDAGGAMAQSLISQLYAIAAGGGTAAEQIEAIRAALAGLPTDKYINIHLNYKASGPGGNQQGDEWNFTLEGEAYATRAAYMDKYGDYGRANDAWQADHRSELNRKGVTGPGQANTRTGEVYQYAFGEHSIVTSPRMMLVGERGPERVDITPGTGARGGGGGGSVTVNFNSLVPPNEFEVRQLAAKLKSYMRM